MELKDRLNKVREQNKEIKEELDALEKGEMDKLRQLEIEACRAEMKKSAIHELFVDCEPIIDINMIHTKRYKLQKISVDLLVERLELVLPEDKCKHGVEARENYIEQLENLDSSVNEIYLLRDYHLKDEINDSINEERFKFITIRNMILHELNERSMWYNRIFFDRYKNYKSKDRDLAVYLTLLVKSIDWTDKLCDILNNSYRYRVIPSEIIEGLEVVKYNEVVINSKMEITKIVKHNGVVMNSKMDITNHDTEALQSYLECLNIIIEKLSKVCNLAAN